MGTRNVLPKWRSTLLNTHLLHREAPIIFAPTEISIVDWECLVKTADHLRAALWAHQHFVSAQLVPVSDDSGTEALMSLHMVGRYAAKDVCEEHNLLESEVTLLNP
jgi:hypothetical protein